MNTAGTTAAAAVLPHVREREFPHLRAFAAALAAAGVRDVSIAPGARSTPLVVSLARQPQLRCHSHVDERSAAFFGLGAAMAARRPVALLCTSGTAAANFYPAVVEASHNGVPLVILTADRPAELRDRGADQTIDQLHLYGRYAKWFVEVGAADCGVAYFAELARRAVGEACGVPAGVVHLNFPLREPLLAPPAISPSNGHTPSTGQPPILRGAPQASAADIARLAGHIAATARGLILCGPADHTSATCDAIAAFAEYSGYPILADPTSQMRRSRYAGAVVQCYDGLADAAADRLAPALVLRFGRLPTSKRLRLWLQRLAVPQLVVEPRGSWNDPLGTAAEIWPTDIAATCDAVVAALAEAPRSLDRRRWRAAWNEADQRARRAVAALVDGEQQPSGVGVFHRIARTMPAGALLYVGNSLPIRQLEAVWPADGGDARILCNRGANGIDGVVSSILGAAAVSPTPVVGVVGDLSFYHDLNGLLAARRRRIDATIVVLNNDGGGIFSMLPMAELGDTFDEFFTTSHGLDFRCAADLYGCAFDRVTDWRQFEDALRRAVPQPGTNIIEVRLDREADLAITRRVTEAAAAAVRGD